MRYRRAQQCPTTAHGIMSEQIPLFIWGEMIAP